MEYREVVRRNRRATPASIERSSRGRRGRVAYTDPVGLRAYGGAITARSKQPGRTVGPSPKGSAPAKPNKLIDRDGNPRIAPLTRGQRFINYGFPHAYAATAKQVRRMRHKANHANAPFGDRTPADGGRS